MSSMLRRRAASQRRITSKELDFLVLAGCSCLLTLLCHPTINAVQHAAVGSTGRPMMASSLTPSAHALTVHVTLPPRRESLQEDEDQEQS